MISSKQNCSIRTKLHEAIIAYNFLCLLRIYVFSCEYFKKIYVSAIFSLPQKKPGILHQAFVILNSYHSALSLIEIYIGDS